MENCGPPLQFLLVVGAVDVRRRRGLLAEQKGGRVASVGPLEAVVCQTAHLRGRAGFGRHRAVDAAPPPPAACPRLLPAFLTHGGSHGSDLGPGLR